MSDDDVGGDNGNAGGRGGGGGDAGRGGVGTVRDDDVGGDGRDDDDSVSRGGTPVPLSDESGATPGGVAYAHPVGGQRSAFTSSSRRAHTARWNGVTSSGGGEDNQGREVGLEF